MKKIYIDFIWYQSMHTLGMKFGPKFGPKEATITEQDFILKAYFLPKDSMSIFQNPQKFASPPGQEIFQQQLV